MPNSSGQADRAETERFVLTNRHGKRIVGLIDYPAGTGPVPDVLVVCHGYGGDKDGEYLRAIAATLREAGIAVVRFDFTNAAGESDGTLRDASVAGYADDLDDVLDFAARQPRLAGSRVSIGGHSYAGMVVLVVAARRPGIAAVFFLSAVFDRTAEFDMPAIAARVGAPIFVVHGERDREVPLAQPEALRRAARDKVAGWTIVRGADHNYRAPGAALALATTLRDAILGLAPAAGSPA
jgi:dienelactone hydrolase